MMSSSCMMPGFNPPTWRGSRTDHAEGHAEGHGTRASGGGGFGGKPGGHGGDGSSIAWLLVTNDGDAWLIMVYRGFIVHDFQ